MTILVSVCTNSAAPAPCARCAPDRAWRWQLVPAEQGFTLVELLVTIFTAIVLISSILALLESSQQIQARDSEWALVLQEDRVGLSRMVRDLRQATEVVEPSSGAASSYVVVKATIGGKAWKIKYECAQAQSGTTYDECLRFAAEEGKSFPSKGARTAIDVTNGSSVFTYSPTTRTEAKLVTAKLEIPAKGTFKEANSVTYAHKVVLEDGAFMRNLYPEG